MKKELPLAIIGCDTPKNISSRLTEIGFKVCVLERDNRLPMPTSSHADMITLRIADTFFCSDKYLEAFPAPFSLLKEYGYKIKTIDTEISNEYPHDIPLNLACVGKYLFGKLDSTSERIKAFAKESNIIPVSVKQGYAKCSTLALGSSAIITADITIASVAENHGIDVLKTENSPFSVTLAGYDYGFIGGACGVYQNKVYFTGNIDNHPNALSIRTFCQKHGFDVVSLCDGILIDIGGIIFAESLM